MCALESRRRDSATPALGLGLSDERVESLALTPARTSTGLVSGGPPPSFQEGRSVPSLMMCSVVVAMTTASWAQPAIFGATPGRGATKGQPF